MNDMKTKAIFCIMTLLPMITMTSCESYVDEQPEVIIEPEDLPMFEFGEDGIPFRYEWPNLSDEMQENLQKEFVGYGWKWMQTNEIEESGQINVKGYYEMMIGVSPKSYYIESDTKFVTFSHSDALNANQCTRSGYQLDVKTGILTSAEPADYGVSKNLYMRVWSIYKLSGRWYMSCVQPLCIRTTEGEREYVVWGTSQYVRMTDTELREMQKQHSYKQE